MIKDSKKYLGLHSPYLKGNEKKYLNKSVSTNYISTFGPYVEKFEKKLKNFTKSNYVIAVNSGTSALHISLLLSNTKPGDEVIVPTISFIAPINAIIYCKASPIFMDVDEYLNIDVEKTIYFLKKKTITRNKITYNKKTKKRISTLLLVHVFGNLANVKPLIKICKEKNIDIVEDAAESIGSYYKNYKNKKHSGTIGKFGCLSFNGNKLITTGGGGAILTQSKFLSDKARYLANQAKNDSIKFIHNEVGYNYRMSNLHAAVGLGQIEKIKKILLNKKKIYNQYLKNISSIKGIKVLNHPIYCEANNWINLIRINKKSYKKSVKKLIEIFAQNKIQVRPLWFPNHLQKPFRKFQKFQIENAQKVVSSILCLPSSASLKKNQINKIVSLL